MGRDLRMRESSERRDTVFPWGHAPDTGAKPGELVPIEPAPTPYAVGDAICNNYRPPSFGTVISVDAAGGTMAVEWDDGEARYGAITYPIDATFLRKAWPWEL